MKLSLEGALADLAPDACQSDGESHTGACLSGTSRRLAASPTMN